MWFDLVLIDRVFSNGSLASHHIRSKSGAAFPVDRLEDIDPSFRELDVVDKGPLRIYDTKNIETTILNSKLRNFVFNHSQIFLQLEHIGMPLASGYYAILFPFNWRIKEINIYDPYDNVDNAAEKRSYKEVILLWDPKEKISCAQFNMRSPRRGTFSIGVIASLVPASSNEVWTDQEGPLELIFSDDRHHGHKLTPDFAQASSKVFSSQSDVPAIMPGINISASLVPSINIVEWGRYIRDKIRRIGQ